MELIFAAIVFTIIGACAGYCLARSRFATGQVDAQLMVNEFEKLSRASLRDANEQLLQTAEMAFKHAQVSAKGEIDQQRLQIQHLVEPMKSELDKLQRFIATSDNERKVEWGGLSEQMRQMAETNIAVQAEAAALKNVLRSSTATRGRWGETQLRRVVELAGMLEYCDFAEQQSVSDDEGRSRADLIVYLPGNIQIAVDAKVPYSAYEKAVNTDDPELQKQHFMEHTRQLRLAADGLTKRRYWEKYVPSPGFCLLFVPGDGSLQAALTHDPTLWEWAAERHVLLTSPSTLITMLRLASVGWQQQRQTDSAQEIARVGKDLYDSLTTMFSHIDTFGKSLGATVGAYSKMIGSLEGRVLPRARRLKDLGIDNGKELIEPREINEHPRELRLIETELEVVND